MAVNNKFKNWEKYLSTTDRCKSPNYQQSWDKGWDYCKDEVFNILNSLHFEPNTKISLNEIIALMKEKL